MKQSFASFASSILALGLLAACEDPLEISDPSPAPSAGSIANFLVTDSKLNEVDHEGEILTIQLSSSLQSEGSIEINVESPNALYNTHFVTIPAALNGKITLVPAIGESIARITVIPIDNSIITGELELSLTISHTSGSIRKGTELNQVVWISDDELTNKPKGYVVNAGLWGLKKIYEYDEAGRIQSVNIENYSPAKSTRTETYYYDTSGRLEKINTHPEMDIIYTWSNGKIIKSETIEYGALKRYTKYDYDAHGNVSGTANYSRLPDGQFKMESLIAYLYFTDGNLYKSLLYIPTGGAGEYTLLSTRTYEGYLNAENPFPMVDILPTVKAQKKLPSTFRIEENGMNLLYTFSYEFSSGRVTRRTTTGGQGSETADYLYY